jgi:hypothetical protein
LAQKDIKNNFGKEEEKFGAPRHFFFLSFWANSPQSDVDYFV